MREYIVRNLTDDEKSKIIKKLGRNPNDVE